MSTQDNLGKNEQSRKVDLLHDELRQWQSNLHFLKDEMVFIDGLLNSYIFQPNTPNLFERIQNYLSRLQRVKRQHADLTERLGNHENNLGGMLECTDTTCDLPYYQHHNSLKIEATNHLEAFQKLKSEIFNYAGGILKKNKPET